MVLRFAGVEKEVEQNWTSGTSVAAVAVQEVQGTIMGRRVCLVLRLVRSRLGIGMLWGTYQW